MTPKFLIIDLFCGAGGTTLGFTMAKNNMAKVIACVNHDPKAIKSHWQNHPEVKHYEEDILNLDLTELVQLLNHYRKLYPNAKVILWASLECTNFSKAKGGQPRDADSRTLAWGLPRYIDALNPDYIQIENVVEFMSWGPLDKNGKPVSRKNGLDWLKWREFICSQYGYTDEWKELNSADFGAYTSRNRLFGIFAKSGLPIVFPKPTHSKTPSKNSLFGDLSKWKAVKDVLDFEDEGKSIFNRDTPLVDASLERIYAGLVKFVAGGKDSFLLKYNSMNQAGGYNAPSVDEPCPTVACQNRLGIVNTSFLQMRYGGTPEGKTLSVERPARTITTTDHHHLVQPTFLAKYHKTGENVISIESPASTITTKDRIAKVECFLTKYNTGNPDSMIQSTEVPAATLTTKDTLSKIEPQYWLDKQYSGAHNHQSVEHPAGTVMTNDKHSLVKCDPWLMDCKFNNVGQSIGNCGPTVNKVGHHHVVTPFVVNTNFGNNPSSIESPAPTIVASRRHMYLLNPSHGGHTQTIDNPCPVIVARQDKAPLYLINAVEGNYQIPVYECDSEVMIKIKEFMVLYGIVDIKMRMLKVPELLKIQGFPVDYKLEGNQSDQKKFIGNSVVPLVVKSWTEALAKQLAN